MGELGYGGRKKKELIPGELEKEPSPQKQLSSRLDSEPKGTVSFFVPPEAFGSTVMDEEVPLLELESATGWDIATRYHEFKTRENFKKRLRELRRVSAQAVLDRAQEVLGSITHSTEPKCSPLLDVPSDAEQVDIDLDETIESSPLSIKEKQPLNPEDIWMGYREHRKQALVLSVDTSLSMTGEKLALTAVALAVVLLQFPEDPVGIVAFENEAQVLKYPDEHLPLSELIERFIDVPAQGYTHLEDGLKCALSLVRGISGGRRPASAVLLTDGKYTAGRDPAYLASRFGHLIVVKMGSEKASEELCRELAHKGHGLLREVGQLESLPSVMYNVVKDLLRGRSLV